MNPKKYITIVDFTAFTRQMQQSFVDSEPIMKYNLKRRISLICNTALINKIQTFEGVLVNQESFKHEPPVANPQLEKVLKTLDLKK